MKNSVVKVSEQLTIRKNIVHLIAEEECFPFRKGDVVRSVTRKTYDKIPKEKGKPLVIVL
jgi:hypothetical protein